MTCIVGVKKDGEVYIGADYVYRTDEEEKPYCGGSKIFVKNDYLIAYCGQVRFGQILQFSFNPPAPPKSVTMKFMATKFAKALSSVLSEEDHTGAVEGTILVAVRGKLFQIHDDMAIAEIEDSVALGTGGLVGRAAMAALKESGVKFNPEQIINIALKVSSDLLTSVGGPFTIAKI